MRKIYSLLLLGGLLFFGVQSVWATNYLKGSWDSYASGIAFDGNTATVTLEANTEYTFGIQSEGGWRTANTTIRHSVTGYNFENGSSPDCKLVTTVAGVYTITTTSWPKKGDSYYYPVVDVTYPSRTYSATLDNSSTSWTTVKAHIYYNEDNTDIAITTWHGETASNGGSGNLYTFSYSSTIKPEYITWNNGDAAKINDMAFHNGATYAKVNSVWTYYYSLTIGTQGWASMYLDFPVKVPANATAYYASATTNTSITLSPISAGSVIPANQAVIVKAAAGTYEFYYDGAAPVEIATNLFAGTIVPEPVVANTVYVLSPVSTTSSCVFGLYTGTTLGANKAYMLASNRPASAPAVDRISFIIEDENNATDIKNVEANEAGVKFIENGKLFIQKNGVVYDMMGTIVK